MRRGKTRPNELVVLERRQYIYRLRQGGASYEQIYETISSDAQWQGRLPESYCPQSVSQDILRHMAKHLKELQETTEQVRLLELHRLDRLQIPYWKRALNGDLNAGKFVLALMARRERYIPGLAAPSAVTLTSPDGTVDHFGAAVANDKAGIEAALYAQAEFLRLMALAVKEAGITIDDTTSLPPSDPST